MSEKDLYFMYLPQIAELIVSCQQMEQKAMRSGRLKQGNPYLMMPWDSWKRYL